MGYTIFRGWHYSTFLPWFRTFCKKTSSIVCGTTLEFDSSMIYEIDEPSCVNKLFGFCFGLFGVHKNSVRFGWSYATESESFVLWRYVYSDGKLEKVQMGMFHAPCGTKLSLIISATRIAESSDEVTVQFRLTEDPDGKMSPLITDSLILNTGGAKLICGLGPYFGGNSVAPHTMRIPLSKMTILKDIFSYERDGRTETV